MKHLVPVYSEQWASTRKNSRLMLYRKVTVVYCEQVYGTHDTRALWCQNTDL